MAPRWLLDFVRSVLPGRTAYNLRKQAGSMVAQSDPRGLWAAQEFLGHESITTTQAHYASPIDPVEGVTELRFR